MKVSFDKFNRLETPAIILCNPGSLYEDGLVTNALGELTHISDLEIEANFNSQSKINFRLYRVDHTDSGVEQYEASLYDMAVNKRYLYVDGFGYFIISECQSTIEGDFRYKDITASSCESELSSVLVPYLDGTYRMRTSGDDIGLLDILIQRMKNWTIGEVDQSIEGLFRTFINTKKKTTGDTTETTTTIYNTKNIDDTTSIYEFLTTSFQDAYECIVLFDTVNRTVNVYDQRTYIKTSEVHLTSKDLVNRLQVTEDDANIYTVLRVTGYDELGISDVNPIGTNLIYDFSPYKSWMSQGLQAAIDTWEAAIASNMNAYYSASRAYEEFSEEYYTELTEIDRLNIVLDLYYQIQVNITTQQNTKTLYESDEEIVSHGGTPVPIQESVSGALDDVANLIDETQNQIVLAEDQRDILIVQRNSMISQMNAIFASTALENAFTPAQLEELSWYMFEGNYKYEYIAVTDHMTILERFAQKKALYDRAISALKSASKRRYTFAIEAESFVFDSRYKSWTSQLETGCGVYVEVIDGTVQELFLSGVTVNFDDTTVSLRLGSTIDRNDLRSLYIDVFKDITKTGRSIIY